MGDGPNLNQMQRAQKLTALLASGVSQTEAAKLLNVSRSTIKRDLQEIRPSVEAVKDLQARAADYIEQVMPIERRIDNYVVLSKHDPNGSVRHAATARLDDMQGFVPQRELIKVKNGEQPANQPLFVFQSGAQISFGPTTIGGDVKSLHNTSTAALDITPTTSSDSINGITRASDQGGAPTPSLDVRTSTAATAAPETLGCHE